MVCPSYLFIYPRNRYLTGNPYYTGRDIIRQTYRPIDISHNHQLATLVIMADIWTQTKKSFRVADPVKLTTTALKHGKLKLVQIQLAIVKHSTTKRGSKYESDLAYEHVSKSRLYASLQDLWNWEAMDNLLSKHKVNVRIGIVQCVFNKDRMPEWSYRPVDLLERRWGKAYKKDIIDLAPDLLPVCYKSGLVKVGVYDSKIVFVEDKSQ